MKLSHKMWRFIGFVKQKSLFIHKKLYVINVSLYSFNVITPVHRLVKGYTFLEALHLHQQVHYQLQIYVMINVTQSNAIYSTFCYIDERMNDAILPSIGQWLFWAEIITRNNNNKNDVCNGD